MDCRGHEQRVRLAKDWTIKPVAHIKLINGKVIPGDAGGTIKDSYFIFECTHKTKINKVKYIHCGKTVAKDFSKIIEQPLPEIFNPLKSKKRLNFFPMFLRRCFWYGQLIRY